MQHPQFWVSADNLNCPLGLFIRPCFQFVLIYAL